MHSSKTMLCMWEETPDWPLFVAKALLGMGANGNESTLVTRFTTFSGKYLFVNINHLTGQLRVEILDKGSEVIEPYSYKNCQPIQIPSTKTTVSWHGARDLSKLAGTPVRFKFCLCEGKLYSLWISPSMSGSSRGFLAVGGPGLTGQTDS